MFDVHQFRDAVVVALPQQMDAGNAHHLGRSLPRLEGGPGPLVVLDLARVAALDSAAFGEMFRLHRARRACGGDVVLAGASPGVRRLLAVTRMDHVFRQFDSVEAALRGAGERA